MTLNSCTISFLKDCKSFLRELTSNRSSCLSSLRSPFVADVVSSFIEKWGKNIPVVADGQTHTRILHLGAPGRQILHPRVAASNRIGGGREKLTLPHNKSLGPA